MSSFLLQLFGLCYIYVVASKLVLLACCEILLSSVFYHYVSLQIAFLWPLLSSLFQHFQKMWHKEMACMIQKCCSLGFFHETWTNNQIQFVSKCSHDSNELVLGRKLLRQLNVFGRIYSFLKAFSRFRYRERIILFIGFHSCIWSWFAVYNGFRRERNYYT